MLKIEDYEVPSAKWYSMVTMGMRNPKASWERSDSYVLSAKALEEMDVSDFCSVYRDQFVAGENDKRLMMALANGGSVDAKYRREIPVIVNIDAPLYWWKEFDQYRVGVTTDSCSTMHTIHKKPFTLADFSLEHLDSKTREEFSKSTLVILNQAQEKFLENRNKDNWWTMIQLLPSSLNQMRTTTLNYEVLTNIYHTRRQHKLDEWHVFCDWIETLPLSQIITLKED